MILLPEVGVRVISCANANLLQGGQQKGKWEIGTGASGGEGERRGDHATSKSSTVILPESSRTIHQGNKSVNKKQWINET